MKIDILNDEYWYGLCVDHGIKMPIGKNDEYKINLCPNPTGNQTASIFVSSKGRFIYCDKGIILSVENGVISANSENENVNIVFSDGHENLKGAFLALAEKYIKPNGITPPEAFFGVPQYNTWIELNYLQTQDKILEYAHNLLNAGYSPGIIMIDDGWNEYYGKWTFRAENFPDSKSMMKELHDLGFKVMLWICPFISPDSAEFRYLKEKNCLIKNKDGSTAVREWWNGYSAILDLSNPEAIEWFKIQTQNLIDDYGADGFKFDAGDACYYKKDDITFGNISDENEQTQLLVKFALNYPYNELRAGFGLGGVQIVNRLGDKNHSWTGYGLDSLIPNQLTQGILGFAFGCPDMIGGGQVACFINGFENIDEELFVRYSQCSALMPMMQFSAAPWRVLKPENAELCLKSAKLHEEFAPLILKLAKESAKTGEPVTRFMEYEFPGQNMEKITDQFMLGNNILAAPVLTKSETERTVILPKGKWRYVDGTEYSCVESKEVKVKAPLDILPYFVKL
ncbi:glycoside hydrolase [Clostridia bacterium]|nr:glycoside hydrolase [Clostridia bacterium]